MQPNRTFRFSIWVNDGWVKLSMRPDTRLTWSQSYPTDEGYHAEERQWEWNGTTLNEEWTSGGVDCDGPLWHDGKRHATSLMTWDGQQVPDWQDGKVVVTDVYAQQMGY